jgi:hypothetical protein
MVKKTMKTGEKVFKRIIVCFLDRVSYRFNPNEDRVV